VIRLGANLVLARLLFPKAFGLMLLVNVFLQGLQLFSDLGIGASIIQHDRTDRSFVDTAWTIQIVRGVVLWVATLVIAWPASAIYGEGMLRWMIPVAGLTALLDGFMSTAIHSANRDLRLARLQVFELGVQVTSAAVTISSAWIFRSVWALVAGMVAASVARVAFSHLFMARERNRLRWDPQAASSLLHFGKWVFASSMVTFLAQQGDRLIFGKMLPLERLGVYNIALTLCEAPSMLVLMVSFKVFFPLFSEMRRTSPDVDAAYQKVRSALALVGGAGALGLIVAGPLLVRVLYDRRYAEASWLLQTLAFGIWGSSLVHFTASSVLASGRVKWLAAANAARLVWVVATVPLAFWRWGFEVGIVFVVLADLPRYVALGLACREDGLHIFGGDLRRTALLAVAAAAGLLVLRVGGAERFLTAAAACALSLGIWIVANRQAAGWFVEKARSTLAARRAA
jgi:O-antigen/teichoic acid export membrane protein